VLTTIRATIDVASGYFKTAKRRRAPTIFARGVQMTRHIDGDPIGPKRFGAS
jgi:hypothetical protein